MRGNCTPVKGVIFVLILSGIIFCHNSITATDSPSFSAVIAEGGHIKSSEFYLYSDDVIKVNVTVTKGGPVDVYLMTDFQYEAAYSGTNETTKAISYIVAKEKITSTEFKFKVPSYDDESPVGYEYYDFYDSISVIVDNRNCSITPQDANSSGIVEVSVKIKIEQSELMPGFGEFSNFMGFICVISVVIILIIIILLIVYFIRSRPGKEEHYPQQYYPQQHYYYQQPPWVTREIPSKTKPKRGKTKMKLKNKDIEI
jgi:flagellar basal body-associated protein FliL